MVILAFGRRLPTRKRKACPPRTSNGLSKKGTGEGSDGAQIEEITYEGYGPSGVAVLVEAQTDNRNRTSSEVRAAFKKCNGNLGASNSVAWIFHKRGQFSFDATQHNEDSLMEAALEAGAEDVVPEGDSIVVTTDWKAFSDVLEHFEKEALKFESGEVTMVPENFVKVGGKDAENVLKLIERLEDLEDVQKVYANFDIDDAELERIAGA